MTAAIGFQAVQAGLVATSTGIDIGEAYAAEVGIVSQQKAQIAGIKILMKRRIAERAVELAGVEAALTTNLGAQIEGRSLDVAALNITNASARETADDIFVTQNQINSAEKQIKAFQQKAKRDRINIAIGGASKALGFSEDFGNTLAADQAARLPLGDGAGVSNPSIKKATANDFTGITTDFTGQSVDLLGRASV